MAFIHYHVAMISRPLKLKLLITILYLLINNTFLFWQNTEMRNEREEINREEEIGLPGISTLEDVLTEFGRSVPLTAAFSAIAVVFNGNEDYKAFPMLLFSPSQEI